MTTSLSSKNLIHIIQGKRNHPLRRSEPVTNALYNLPEHTHKDYQLHYLTILKRASGSYWVWLLKQISVTVKYVKFFINEYFEDKLITFDHFQHTPQPLMWKENTVFWYQISQFKKEHRKIYKHYEMDKINNWNLNYIINYKKTTQK